jgi:hypothetical protein
MVEPPYRFVLMFFPPFTKFVSEFLSISKTEKEMVLEAIFGDVYSNMRPGSKEDFQKGKGKKVKNRLTNETEDGPTIIPLLNDINHLVDNLFEGDEDKVIPYEEADEAYIMSMIMGFNGGSQAEAKRQGEDVIPDTLFSDILDYIKGLSDKSKRASELFDSLQYDALKKLINETPMCDGFWDGLNLNELAEYTENHPFRVTLRLRGFVYQLALAEAFMLSKYTLDMKSNISGAMTRGPYLKKDKPKAPLKRFFLALAYDKDKNPTPTLTDVAKHDGLSKLRDRIAEGKKVAPDVVEALEYLDSEDKYDQQYAADFFREKVGSWKATFMKEFQPLKKNSKGEDVYNQYSSRKAKSFLDNVILKDQDAENFPLELYWMFFFGCRAFHAVWCMYEVNKDKSNFIEQAMPGGAEPFIEFYDKAFAHACKVITEYSQSSQSSQSSSSS